MSESSDGFMAYAGTGVGAVRGEAEKWRSWDVALRRRACCGPIRSAGEYRSLGARQISIDLARVEKQWSGARRCSFRRF
jgi:opacity protein-like surface antigen